jgi:hypothetical protein
MSWVGPRLVLDFVNQISTKSFGKSPGETMEKEERYSEKERRSGLERRKSRSFSYKGIDRRSGRDRRKSKDPRRPS